MTSLRRTTAPGAGPGRAGRQGPCQRGLAGAGAAADGEQDGWWRGEEVGREPKVAAGLLIAGIGVDLRREAKDFGADGGAQRQE